eukprot:1479293-Prymnesium_polylepis.1
MGGGVAAAQMRDFGGVGAVGPQDRKREKRALYDPILTQQRPRSSTRHTSPDSTTTWPRGGRGETGSVYIGWSSSRRNRRTSVDRV